MNLAQQDPGVSDFWRYRYINIHNRYIMTGTISANITVPTFSYDIQRLQLAAVRSQLTAQLAAVNCT